jgi:hypothetical protein
MYKMEGIIKLIYMEVKGKVIPVQAVKALRVARG